MPEARRRRRGRTAVAVVVTFAVAVAAVVIALRTFGGASPSNTCAAQLDGDAEPLDAEQADNAALMGAIAMHRELPARAATIAIATAMQESKLENIDYGDRDSLGLFQQRPSQGWGTPEEIMDPVYSTNAFYDVLVTVEGWESAEVTEAAQDVQRSAFPDAYAQHEDLGRAYASALTGYSQAALVCELEPATEGGGSAPDAMAAAQERLARDLVEIGVEERDGLLVVDTTVLPPGSDNAPERRGWSVAQWAVATASATGISVVATDDRVWLREDVEDPTWVTLEEADLPDTVAQAAADAAPGEVVIA